MAPRRDITQVLLEEAGLLYQAEANATAPLAQGIAGAAYSIGQGIDKMSNRMAEASKKKDEQDDYDLVNAIAQDPANKGDLSKVLMAPTKTAAGHAYKAQLFQQHQMGRQVDEGIKQGRFMRRRHEDEFEAGRESTDMGLARELATLDLESRGMTVKGNEQEFAKLTQGYLKETYQTKLNAVRGNTPGSAGRMQESITAMIWENAREHARNEFQKQLAEFNAKREKELVETQFGHALTMRGVEQAGDIEKIGVQGEETRKNIAAEGEEQRKSQEARANLEKELIRIEGEYRQDPDLLLGALKTLVDSYDPMKVAGGVGEVRPMIRAIIEQAMGSADPAVKREAAQKVIGSLRNNGSPEDQAEAMYQEALKFYKSVQSTVVFNEATGIFEGRDDAGKDNAKKLNEMFKRVQEARK